MGHGKHKDFCTLSPDHLPHLSFNPLKFEMKCVSCCCAEHDEDYAWLYGLPRTEENMNKRKLSDINLRENIIAEGHYRFFAWAYFIAVRGFGWIGLWEKKQ